MHEYTSPGEVAVAHEDNLTSTLWEAARAYPNHPIVSVRRGGTFVDVTTDAFRRDVAEVAKGLIGLGIEPGARVCVYAKTRMEWTLLDYAIWAAGCVTVPIYETSSAEQVAWIATDSGAVAIFAEDEPLLRIVHAVQTEVPTLKHAYAIETGGLEEVKASGAAVGDDVLEERAHAASGDDLATIVYTSGTTGRPKGCLITHHNFLWEVSQALAATGLFQRGQSTLLFLPLAHIFARVIQVACVKAGVRIGYSTGTAHLVEELQLFGPDFLLSVPRIFEKVFNGAQQKAHAEGKGMIFDRAASVAIDYSRADRAGKVSLPLKLQHLVFDRLVYAKLRDAVGGNVRYAVSGAAALGERLGHFFRGVGITILEGYGLTETSAGATLNTPDGYRIGSVGRPLPGSSVRIAEDGEILIRGPHVFRGYHGNDEATAQVLDDDGWFHSGDIGELDGEGFLRITGRKKELIVTAGGKNVAPAVLEDRIRAHALVSQAMVVGDDQPFIAALVAIDPDEFPRWAQQHGKESRTVADLVSDPELRATVQAAVDDANKAVSRAEAIRSFRIVPDDFTIEGGELTPTLKVKRSVVAEKYRPLIDDLYAGVARA